MKLNRSPHYSSETTPNRSKGLSSQCVVGRHGRATRRRRRPARDELLAFLESDIHHLARAISSGCDPAAVLIDDALAVLLKKFAFLRRQEVDHELRRPAESYPSWRHHDRPVEENGMRLECVEQDVLGEVAIVKPQFAKN